MLSPLACHKRTANWRALPQIARDASEWISVIFVSIQGSLRPGAEKAAHLLLAGSFGLTAEMALALSPLKRARDLALGLPLPAGWQLFEQSWLWPRIAAFEIEVTGAPAASSSSLARRRREHPRLRVVLAVVALLVQIASPGLHAPVRIGSTNGNSNPTIGLDEHALCLAPHNNTPAPLPPADKTPKADHDFAACCVWHAAPGAVLAPATDVEQVAFVASRVVFATPAAEIPTRFDGAVRARAPPPASV